MMTRTLRGFRRSPAPAALRPSLRFRFSTLQPAASRMTIVAGCRAEDDEQFHRGAEPSIALNEGGHGWRERQRADAGSESKVVAATSAVRGTLANGTRGEE